MKTAAIIGCGKRLEGKEGWAIGYNHAIGWRAAFPEIRLLAVDINQQNLNAFAKEFGLSADDLFTSTDALYDACTPDFVSVCTWPALHAPMTIEAAERGVKGIACEKPLALNVGEIDDMRAACDKAGARLAVCHQRRHNPRSKLTRQLLADGRLGENVVMEARVGGGWDILSWSCHWLDLANYFFDSTPTWIMAGLDHRGSRRYQHAVEDASIIMTEYPGGEQAIFATGPDCQGEAGIVLRGSTGFLRFSEWGTMKLYDDDGLHELTVDHDVDCFGCLFAELADAVETGADMINDVAHSGLATELAYAAHESARTMRRIELPFTAKYAPLEVVQHAPKSSVHGVKTLLYADSHFGSGGREGLAEALAALTGVTPVLVDAETQGLTRDDLAHVDAVVIYHTQKVADDTTKSALTTWVESSKPMLIAHAGLGAWPEWPEFAAWAGYIWDWGVSSHPHEPSTLTPTDPESFDFDWQEGWLPKDECFVDLKQTGTTDDVLHVTISTGSYPAAWLNTTYPNIGGWMPGHRSDSWRVPVMRQGFAAMLRQIVVRA